MAACCSFLVLAFLTLFSVVSSTSVHASQLSPRGKGVSLQQLQANQPLKGLPPNTNVTLKAIGLGVGVQNYSCASRTAQPQAFGAVATLYDITAALQKTNDLSSDLSTKSLRLWQKTACLPNKDYLSDHSCENQINKRNFPILGVHYFATIQNTGVPTFSLGNGDLLSAQKIKGTAAPADAYPGRNNAGAVDWLFLTQDNTGRSIGLSEVYRINTAGGSPLPNQCSTGNSTYSIKYTSEYWFYD